MYGDATDCRAVTDRVRSGTTPAPGLFRLIARKRLVDVCMINKRRCPTMNAVLLSSSPAGLPIDTVVHVQSFASR